MYLRFLIGTLETLIHVENQTQIYLSFSLLFNLYIDFHMETNKYRLPLHLATTISWISEIEDSIFDSSSSNGLSFFSSISNETRTKLNQMNGLVLFWFIPSKKKSFISIKKKPPPQLVHGSIRLS